MAKKLKLGSGLENLINQKIKNSYSTSTTDTYSCNHLNNFQRRIDTLYGEITTQGKFTLTNNVQNYDFIIVTTAVNTWDNYTYLNFYSFNLNLLYSWQYQRLFYPSETLGGLAFTGYFQLYDNIIDTTGLSNIGTVKILKVWGIKLG